MLTAKELVKDAVGLVSLPDIYIRLRSLLDRPDYALAEVGALIGQDPGLTARLLRLVNSPYFGVATRIETVTRAVNMLGTQQVHDLVLATSVADTFSAMSTGVMHMRTFWEGSIRCGVTARLLAIHCNMLDSERLFVAGLLRDMGHVLMYQKYPAPCQKALIRATQAQELVFRVERELFGFDYAQVGGELAQAWNLPPALESAIRYHTVPTRAEEFRLEASIIHLASVVTETQRWTGSGDKWVECADPMALQLTDLSVETVDHLLVEAGNQVAATVDLILPNLHEAS